MAMISLHQSRYNQCLLKEGPSSPRYSCLILFNKQGRFIVFPQPFPKIHFLSRLCHDMTPLLLAVLRLYIVLSILWLRYICRKINSYESMDLQWNCCRNIDLYQLNIGSNSSQVAHVSNYLEAKWKMHVSNTDQKPTVIPFHRKCKKPHV